MPAPATAAAKPSDQVSAGKPVEPVVKAQPKIKVAAKSFPLRAHRHGIMILPGVPVEIDRDHWVQVQLDAGILVEV